jgi:hypothetical protein
VFCNSGITMVAPEACPCSCLKGAMHEASMLPNFVKVWIKNHSRPCSCSARSASCSNTGDLGSAQMLASTTAVSINANLPAAPGRLTHDGNCMCMKSNRLWGCRLRIPGISLLYVLVLHLVHVFYVAFGCCHLAFRLL